MERFVFTDGEKLCYFDGEKVIRRESEYIVRYREYTRTRQQNDEWKFRGEGARFRGDFDRHRLDEEQVFAYINGVQLAGDKLLYTFTVNESSGIYRKYLSDEKAPEEHLLSSREEEYLSAEYDKARDVCAVTVRKADMSSHIGIFHCNTSELTTLTDGDSIDANPSFSAVDTSILYFDSAGIGRTANGGWTGKYSPSVIYRMNVDTLDMEVILSDSKLSFVKPKTDKNGTLYCIERPTGEKSKTNPFLEILLIPVRIVQAIVMFVQAFVMLFTGKSLTSGGDNPTKGRDQNMKQIYVDGNLIQVDKEYKRNRRFKEKDYGFIPRSWKLVKVEGETRTPVKSGICDYSLCGDGSILCTDGRHIYRIDEAGCKKVADADLCLSVAAEKG